MIKLGGVYATQNNSKVKCVDRHAGDEVFFMLIIEGGSSDKWWGPDEIFVCDEKGLYVGDRPEMNIVGLWSEDLE